MNRNEKRREEIEIIVLIIYMLLMSGSVLNAVFSELFTINMLITGALTVYYALRGELRRFRGRECVIFLFLCYLILNAITSMVWWNEWTYLQSYIANFSFFLMSFFISRKVNYHLFTRLYINVVFAIAIISLICFWQKDILLILPSIELDNGVYKFYFIYNQLQSVVTRNCGIFWEPGMYQGFLAMAVLFIQDKEKLNKADVVKLIVLYTTIITTYSTTGYGVMILLIAMHIIRKVERKQLKFLLFIFGIFIALLIIFFGQYIVLNLIDFFPDIVTEKIINRETSFLTRQNSIIYDLIVSYNNPLGVGVTHLDEFLREIGRARGLLLDANTNTIGKAFVYFGVLGGVAYTYIWISGIFRRNNGIISNIILLIIVMLIINTEPHLYTLFFNTIAFYWFSMEYEKSESGL